MSELLTTRGSIQAMLDVEAALAEVQASLGIIPLTASKPIREAAREELYEEARLIEDGRAAGNIAIPLVRQLTERVAASDNDAARYVHWGATSQDIIDTALVLQLRHGIPRILGDLQRAATAASEQASRHAGTVMAGRTWLQQSTPITFGLKCAGWLDALRRVHRGLHDAMERGLVLQFGGASGTLAALDDRGLEVAEGLGKQLRLRVPAMPWHSHRDRIAEVACAVGVVAGTLGKIGRDVILLAQSEIGEVREGTGERAGGSSTMPHKRNPVLAAFAIAAATRAPGLVATVLAAMPQEHERGVGNWQAEWDAIPDLVNVVAESAAAIASSLEHLIIDPARMAANLEATHGLLMAEAVAMRLARRLGKAEAHAIVAAACRRASDEHGHLRDVLMKDPSVTAVLSPTEIAEALTPERYLGVTAAFIERVLDEGRRK